MFVFVHSEILLTWIDKKETKHSRSPAGAFSLVESVNYSYPGGAKSVREEKST